MAVFTPKDYVDFGLTTLGIGADIYNSIQTSKNADKAYDLNKQALQQNDALAREQLTLLDNQNKEQNAIARENIDWQKNIAQQNFGLQQNQFDYQKRLNALQMEREDNAIQRQVADLQAAGFSPLMASGGSPSSPLSSGSAPQYDVSGVSAAQGSYLQLAQQYAQLKQDSMSSHRSAKVQAFQNLASSKQASSFALANLIRGVKQDLNAQYWNIQNYRLNAEHQTKQNELLDEQIKTAKASREWNEENGWRNQSWQNYLVSFLSSFMSPQQAASETKELIEVIKEKGPAAAEKVINDMKNIAPEVKESIKETIKESADEIKKQAQESIDNFKDKYKINQLDFDSKMTKNGGLLLANPFAIPGKKNLEKKKSAYYDSHKSYFEMFGMYKSQFMNLDRFQTAKLIGNPYKELKKWKNDSNYVFK